MKKLIVLFVLAAIPAFATSYYISPTGSNANTCVQAQTITTPKKTFASAFACLAAGDTLLLKDGTYSVTAGTGVINTPDGGAGNGMAPNGSSVSIMTIVQAVNPGLAIIDGETTRDALLVGSDSVAPQFIKFQDLQFIGGIGAQGVANGNHIYIKNTSFESHSQSAGQAFGTGGGNSSPSPSYILAEDIWIYGRERTLLAVFRSDHIVIRRAVIRNDGCNSAVLGCGNNSGNLMLSSTIYSSDHVSFQNVIAFDSINGPNGQSQNCSVNCASDFNTANHGNTSHTFGLNEWLGSMSLFSGYGEGMQLSVDEDSAGSPPIGSVLTPAFTVTNYAAIYAANSVSGADLDISVKHVSGSSSNMYQGILNGLTLKRSGSTSDSMLNINSSTANTSTVTNVVGFGTPNQYVLNSSVTPDYTDVFCTGCTSNYHTTTPTHAITTDPTNDTGPSIKYITRIEAGSTLATAGSGGGILGSTIINKYGCDGCYYGDTSFNTITGNALWPWPNETRIKSEMCPVASPSTNRGFCTFTAAAGQTSTFTRYVWEALGNATPSSVYGGLTGTTGMYNGVTLTGGATLK